MSEEQKCACGLPLHYSDPALKELVERIIAEQGETIRVIIGQRAWMVQRHYIALHGLSGIDVQYLGFQEVAEPHEEAK